MGLSRAEETRRQAEKHEGGKKDEEAGDVRAQFGLMVEVVQLCPARQERLLHREGKRDNGEN